MHGYCTFLAFKLMKVRIFHLSHSFISLPPSSTHSLTRFLHASHTHRKSVPRRRFGYAIKHLKKINPTFSSIFSWRYRLVWETRWNTRLRQCFMTCPHTSKWKKKASASFFQHAHFLVLLLAGSGLSEPGSRFAGTGQKTSRQTVWEIWLCF